MTATKATDGQARRADAPLAELLTDHPAPGVLRLTLARPEQRNSLTTALLEALAQAIDAAGHNDRVRAIVLAAQGGVFCAGHDLKELTAGRAAPDGGRAFTEATLRRCSALMRAIVLCPKPVIAAVQGLATAAGCQLVASCDLAVASEKAGFCTPGVNIGLFCSTPMVALSRNVSRKRAMEMLLLGETLSAHEAATYGLVNRVVAHEALAEAALSLAQRIAAKPQFTVATGKAAFYRQIEMGLEEAYAYASAVMVENMLHAEAKEGIGALLAKRKRGSQPT
jgi:enoyl-CoA hydratase/carnithine racemase